MRSQRGSEGGSESQRAHEKDRLLIARGDKRKANNRIERTRRFDSRSYPWLLPFLRATYCEAGKEAASSWLPHRFRQPVWQHMTRDTRTLTYTLTRFQETKGKLDPSKSTQWSQMYGVRFIK